MSSFTKPLRVEAVDGKTWKLLESFEYYTEDGEHLIRVPEGFITDFASIPRLFWSLVGSPWGEYGKAAVIHDYLYYTQRFTRRKADAVFKEAMKVLGVSWWKRNLMWLSVRTFGWIPWNKKQRQFQIDAYNKRREVRQ